VKGLGEKPCPAALELMLSLPSQPDEAGTREVCKLVSFPQEHPMGIVLPKEQVNLQKHHCWSVSQELHWMFPGAVTYR